MRLVVLQAVGGTGERHDGIKLQEPEIKNQCNPLAVIRSDAIDSTTANGIGDTGSWHWIALPGSVGPVNYVIIRQIAVALTKRCE